MSDETDQKFDIISDLYEECFDNSGDTDYSQPANSLMRWFNASSGVIESLQIERSEGDSEVIDSMWSDLCTLVYTDPEELCEGDLNQWLDSISGQYNIVYDALSTVPDYELYCDWLGCSTGVWGDIRKVFPDWEE